MSRPKLVVVDGSSLIYRAFFALPPLTTADGTPTNAVYGFTAMLLKLLEEEKPEVIIIAFEGGRTFRHTEFADYKAHRPRTPDDLAVQGPLARAAAEVLRIPILQCPGYEADDVIGTLTCRGRDAGYDVLVVTGDLDALQLVNPEVKVLVNRRGITDAQVYDEAAVEERYALPPRLLPDFKALKGDSSDNIPGVPGVGDKTAAALLQEYGSIENLMERAEEVKAAKVKAALLEKGDRVALYKRLATVVTDLPLDTPWEEWKYRGPDVPAARELFRSLEFRTLAARVASMDGADAEPEGEMDVPEVRWRRAAEGEDLRAWVEAARNSGPVSVRALPLPPKSPPGTPLPGVALASAEEAVVLGTEATPEEQGLLAGAADPWDVPPAIRELLAADSPGFLAHDAKREMHALAEREVELAAPVFDTALAAYVLSPGRASYRLEDLARDYLRRGLPSGDPAELAAHEAAAIRDLREPMRRRLEADELALVYDALELPLIPILYRMERAGIAVNLEELKALSVRLGKQVADLEQQAHAAAGRAFNLGSPKQLQDLLFQECGLPSGRRTKTGYSTDSDVLQDLAALHPLPALILEWRELSKLKSTYTDALQSQVDPRDGRVHTSLNQMVAATGRLSSTDPNLQNIPIRTEVGREIRSAFVAAPGMQLLSADYSQIELRIMAHVCRDPELVRAFQEGRDVHAATAAQVFGVPLEAVTSDQRRNAKTVNFAVLYGQKEFGLSRQLRIPMKEAKGLIEAYFARFPGVLSYMEQTLAHVRREGYVTTLPPYGRKRYIPGIHAGNRNERMAAEREAINAPIQGTASDIIKKAMVDVDAAMREQGLRSRMLLQVHDELLFEIVPEEREAMIALVCERMENAYVLSVPLKVETKVGSNWRDVEPA